MANPTMHCNYAWSFEMLFYMTTLDAGYLFNLCGDVPWPVRVDVHLPELQLGQEAGETSA